MKAALVFISFLLFSISIQSFFCSAEEKPDPVLDTNGEKLQVGVEYFILPVIRGRGGGLTASCFGNETCPLSVVQAVSEVDHGVPVTFTPTKPKEGIVRVSTDLNIKFSIPFPTCIQSNVWKLAYDRLTGKHVIHINGVEGNPGPLTLDNWFKIEKCGKNYKLVFCPTVCDFCKVICKHFDTFICEGKRRLALTDEEPFEVMFKKASTSSSL